MLETDIKINDIRDKKVVYGNLIYSKHNDNLYFVNRFNIRKPLTDESTRRIVKQESYTDYIKFLGEWDKKKEYDINSLVKYKNILYLSKSNITDDTAPLYCSNWEPLNNMQKTQKKDISKFIGENKESIMIRKQMIPLVFKETKQTEFIEYIEHSKSCYITKPGRYNVTYNISYQSDIEYLSVMFFIKHDNNEKAIQILDGTSRSFKGKTDNIINVNHNFILEIDDSYENDGFSYNEGLNSYKLIVSLNIDDKEFGKSIDIINIETWMTIYELD